ncbi:MAG: CDGSH iron-sulfur domain-containing protein [Candidatus Bathyarchaeota archaeon]|nr:CDGSH iron-sulfur domain-containing protein [Candidatus Bathyarchaeota archaeon]
MGGNNQAMKITVTRNGPYLVSGNIPLYEMIIKCGQGNIPSEWVVGKKFSATQTYLLCRCGQSKNKPFCDGTHAKTGFDGTETSPDLPFLDMAKSIDGPNLHLDDAEGLCASARFCHRGGDIWDEIAKSDDPQTKANSIRNECDCPSGRLVLVDKETGVTVEPQLEKSIGVILDPAVGVLGPLWVRGGVPVYSAGGKAYHIRNRVTLCRCGKSQNKPFCDSSHYPEEYQEVKR